MPHLLCLKENEKACSSWREISNTVAENLLSILKSEWSEDEPKLPAGKVPRVLEPGFVGCDGYAIHLDAKLGHFNKGFHLLLARADAVEKAICQ